MYEISVQEALQGKEICKLFPLTPTASGDVLGVFGSVPNAYSSRFGIPSLSKSAAIVVSPVKISAAVNLVPCQIEKGVGGTTPWPLAPIFPVPDVESEKTDTVPPYACMAVGLNVTVKFCVSPAAIDPPDQLPLNPVGYVMTDTVRRELPVLPIVNVFAAVEFTVTLPNVRLPLTAIIRVGNGPISTAG